jgi:hypothetical protein
VAAEVKPLKPRRSGRNRPPKIGNPTSVYLNAGDVHGVGGWPEYRTLCEVKLGVSGSFRLNTLMLQDLAQMKGMQVATIQNIGVLEMQVATLIHDGKKLAFLLKKVGVHDDLIRLADKWGLNFVDFKNADEVIGKFLEYTPTSKDRFSRDDVEVFIQMLGKAKEKCLRKAELDKLRLDKLNGVVAPLSEAAKQMVAPPEVAPALQLVASPVAPTVKQELVVETEQLASSLKGEVKAMIASSASKPSSQTDECSTICQLPQSSITPKAKTHDVIELLKTATRPVYRIKQHKPEILLPNAQEVDELVRILGGDASDEDGD